MSILKGNHMGLVNVMTFLETCCRFIPDFYDVLECKNLVMEIQRLNEEAQRAAETAEMEKLTQGMMGSMASKNADDEREEDKPVPPEQVLVVLHSCSEPCKFSEQEVRALIGEIKVN